MDFELKKQLKDKAKYTYGLLNVLKCDIESLRKYANDCNPDKMLVSIRDTEETLLKLTLLVEEIEYILKLDKIQRP